MAIITNKPDVKTTWASGGSVTQPSTTKKLQGWVAEIPPYQIANAIEFNQDTAIKYLFQEGVSEWDSTFEYSATSWVKFNKNLYRAKRANINKQPNNNAADWEIPYLLSSDVQPLVNNKVDKTTKIVAGTGLSGGGDLSTNRTLNIDTAYSPATSMNLAALNLNTITTAGFYYQPVVTQATTARNYPINTAGALLVTVSSGINQEYTTYGSNIRRYIRSYYSGVWSDWVEVLTNLKFGVGSGFVAQGNDSRINNGQTAYSWGNHASAGYASSTVTNALLNTKLNVNANAVSASKLYNTRKVEMYGAVTGGFHFDGQSDVMFETILHQGLGIGQTWQNVKASRSYGTTYTNSSGKPILVIVTNQGGSALMTFTVGGVVISTRRDTYNSGEPYYGETFLVPSGATYRVDAIGSNINLYSWVELR